MQQAIINAVPTQITPQTNHHPAHPFSGDLDFGCIRHRSAPTSTQLSCNDNRQGRFCCTLLLQTMNNQWCRWAPMHHLLMQAKIRDDNVMRMIVCFNYRLSWFMTPCIITSSSRPGPASKASVPWVHEKYFAPSTPRPSYHDTEATMRRVNERSFHPEAVWLQYFILNITTFFWFWKTTLVIIYL